MIHHINCNVLDTYTSIIAHQVNCMGVMGSGVASQIKSRYPEAYKAYKELCDNNSHYRIGLLGRTQLCPVSFNTDGTPRIYVANMFGQYSYGRSKYTVYTDYPSLRQCLGSLSELATSLNAIIALPYKIGCSRGNGDWERVVYPMIESMLKNNDVLLCEHNVGVV